MPLQLHNYGQLQLEALICIAVFFTLLAIALAGTNLIKEKQVKAGNLLIAEAKAQKCALIADMLFSNGGGSIKTSEKCFAGKEHEVRAIFKGEEKAALSLAKKISSSQEKNSTVMVVEIEEHYR